MCRHTRDIESTTGLEVALADCIGAILCDLH